MNFHFIASKVLVGRREMNLVCN